MRTSKGYLIIILLAALAMVIASCGGSGEGTGITGSGVGTTTVAGRVALSSTSTSGASKPGPSLADSYGASKALASLSKSAMDPERKMLLKAQIMSGLSGALEKGGGARDVLAVSFDGEFILSGAVVQIFDAEHPEFIYPIAETLSDENGDFVLNERRYADSNNPLASDPADQYANGSEIPAGRYSLIASKFDANIGKLFVAVQSIVKSYEGPIEGNNLVAQDSDAIPDVQTMFARIKEPITGIFGFDANGDVEATVPIDSAVQVTFSQAMARLSVLDSATLIDNATSLPVPGQWKVSANLLSAAFEPASDLILGDVYKLSINGGKPTATKQTAKNVFGRSIPDDVEGYFQAVPADPGRPEGFRTRPSQSPLFDDYKLEGGQQLARVTAPIRIETLKPLDINYFDITVRPTIGEIPTVLYLGSYKDPAGLDRFIYDIIPSDPLTLGTTYNFTVDGARDLEGNDIIPFNFQFVTETITNGVDPGANALVQQAQAQAKDIFGKWLRGFSDKNVTMLTNYMTGDFAWASNDSEGGSGDDLNRDGRLSAYEFARMLEGWFQLLKACDSKVTGDVVSTIIVNSTAYQAGEISVIDEVEDYNRARMSFLLDVNSQNYSNPSCQETGPPDNLYLELKRINGAWYVSKGADVAPAGGQALKLDPVQNIELNTPRDGEELSLPFSGELRPAFKWTGIANATTYAVVVVDARSPFSRAGWVALVNGIGTENQDMKVNFNPNFGAAGDVFIADVSRIRWFEDNLTAIKPGGEYIWSVIAFDTLNIDEIRFRIFSATRNLATDLIGTSRSREFSIEGKWLEMNVRVMNILDEEYPFDQYLGGYDLTEGTGIETLRLEIFTPSGAPTGILKQFGFGQQDYPLTFVNGYADSGGNPYVDIQLYQGRNDFLVCDGTDLTVPPGSNDWECVDGLLKFFTVMTSAGTPPVLSMSLIDNATGTDMGQPDLWGNIFNGTVEYMDISAQLNGVFDNSDWMYTYINVWNNDNGFNYWDNSDFPPGWSNNFGIDNVPVAEGRNEVNLQAQFYDAGINEWVYFENRVTIEVGPGGGVTQAQQGSSVTLVLPGTTLLDPNWDGFNGSYPLYHAGSVNTTIPVAATVDLTDPTLWCDDWYVINYGWPAGKEICGDIRYGYIEGFGSSAETFGAQIFQDGTWGIVDWNAPVPVIINSGPMSALPDIDVYRGMNFVSAYVYDSNPDQVAFVFSDNSNVFVPPLSVNVDVLLPTTGTLRLNWGSSNYSDFSSTDVDSISVTGIAADIANGSIIANGVSYDHSTSGITSRMFADVAADGSFSFDINLANQWNDIRIHSCEDDGDPANCVPLNTFDLYIYTEAGTTPPKYISVDSPSHNDEVLVAIPLTIYGHIDNSIDGFVPDKYIAVWIDEYDGSGSWMGGTSYYWYDDVYCGGCTDTLTYDPATNYFYTPTYTFDPAYTTQVQAYSYGTTNFGAGFSQSHSHTVYVNNTLEYGEYSYKPRRRR